VFYNRLGDVPSRAGSASAMVLAMVIDAAVVLAATGLTFPGGRRELRSAMAREGALSVRSPADAGKAAGGSGKGRAWVVAMTHWDPSHVRERQPFSPRIRMATAFNSDRVAAPARRLRR
jgi:hypothetical protein